MNLKNDIALVELDKPLTLNTSSVFPLCLPSGNEETFEGLSCVATGWGKTSEDGPLSNVLLKVDLPILDK